MGGNGSNCPDATICESSESSSNMSDGSCVTPRYTVNSNGTVSDDVTTLVWQQALSMDPCPADDILTADGNQTGCTWAHAQTYCQGLTLDGTGWRTPALAELFSLVEAGGNPTIDTTAFPSVPAIWLWTSTADNSNANNGWAVNFFGGSTESNESSDRYLVLCVR